MNRRKTTTLPEDVSGQLDHPSHVIPQLARISKGWQPTPEEMEQLLAHLADCLDCEVALHLLLAALEESSLLLSEPPDEKLARIRSELTQLHEEKQAIKDLPAYRDTLQRAGQEEAARKFPALARHIQHCPACHAQIADVLTG